MPSKKTHRVAGMLSSVVCELMVCSRNQNLSGEDIFKRCVVAGAGGCFGGGLPDRLEPAYHPNHRSVCHSYTALCLTAYGTYKTVGRNDITPYVSSFVRGVTSGYASHLTLDLLTPKGLPLLK